MRQGERRLTISMPQSESDGTHVNNLIPPLFGFGRCPDEKQPFDNCADSTRPIGNDKHARDRFTRSAAVTCMPCHRPPVVSDQNAILLGRDFEERRIFGSS